MLVLLTAEILARTESQRVLPFAITPTKRLSSLLSHTQAGSQRKPMDQFSREKLWHSSNVMGFDVDAELHYRTSLKPVKPLFICLFPMQRTSAGNIPHFCCTDAFFPLLLFKDIYIHLLVLTPLYWRISRWPYFRGRDQFGTEIMRKIKYNNSLVKPSSFMKCDSMP